MNRDDAISRKDAIKALQNVVCISAAIKSRMVGAIEDLPSATQKSGKWNEYYTSQKGNNVFNCKECGHTFVVTQGKDNMNYCPNCGARMESEEISERNMKMWEEIFKAERGDKE